MRKRIEHGPSVRKGVACDQRGAVMVMGVLMAVFLVAALYYAIGIGDALLRRERMQDAADAAVFSAAVVHARGMNIIVLINMIMAALLAILVALKMVETLLIAAIILVSVISFFTGGSLAAAIPAMESARQQAKSTFDTAKQIVYPQLELLHKAARGVRAVVPAASEAEVVDTVVSHYHPPALLGVAMVPRFTLPVEDDKFDVLCEKAGEKVGWIVGLPIKAVAPHAIEDDIGDLIEDAVGGLAKSLSRWFCGDGQGELPPIKIKQEEPRPTLPSREMCIEYGKRLTNKHGYEEDRHRFLCELAEKDERDSAPDREGYCQYPDQNDNDRRCDAYWARASLARTECKPEKGRKLRDFIWQKRKIRLYYLKTAVGWIQKREVVEAELVKGNHKPPCDKEDWSVDAVRSSDPARSVPVCSDLGLKECADPALSSQTFKTGEAFESCDYEEVAQVLGCKEKVERTIKPDIGEKDKTTGKDKERDQLRVPQKFQSGLELGADDLQLRAVVYGSSGSDLSDDAQTIMRMADWGQEDGLHTGAYRAAGYFGRISVAQAEYYYAGKEDRAEWMWHMNWRARLKRFRLSKSKPEGGQEGRGAGDERGQGDIEEWGGKAPSRNFAEACHNAQHRGKGARPGDRCGQIEGDLDFLSSVVAH